MRKEENLSKKQNTYEEMSTEELRALLHQDIWEDTLDDVSVRQITEELRKRGREDASFAEPRLDESWQRLQERLKAEPGIWETEPARQKNPKQNVKWFRTGVAMVAMLAIMFVTILPAAANQFRSIKYVATWTKDAFLLSPIEDVSEESIKYKYLPKLLLEHGVTEPLLPTWLPEGYAYVGCEVNDDFFGGIFLQIQFQHIDTEEIIHLSVVHHTKEGELFSLKDEKDIVVYTANGIQHYILSYNGILSAAWISGNTRYSVGGYVSEEELKQIIDSIYLEEE